MTTYVEDPAWTKRLSQLLLQGEREANLRGEPVLVSATIAIPHVDPLTVFDRAAGYERTFWEQPGGTMSMAAAGAAHRFDAGGPERFAQIEGAWRRLLSTAISDDAPGAPPGPVCVGGFAFDPAAVPSSQWRAFGPGRLTVPKYLVRSAGGESWLTISVLTRTGAPAGEGDHLADLRHLIEPASAAATPDAAMPPVTLDAATDSGPWRSAATAALEAIRAGTLRKVVLARSAHARSNAPLDPATILRRLRLEYQSSTLFAFAFGDACFLGATPERLVAVEGAAVRADCLAGSIARGATPDEDDALGRALLADGKERHEHALVVEALGEALRPLCTGLTLPDAPALLRTSAVQHLHTPVAGTLANGGNVLALAARLHPTPAAGGTPRDAALAFIREHESFDRGWYAGPVGWVDSDGGGEFAVAIRSMLLAGGRATLFGGCGIVAGSDPDREYEESRLKMRPMLWALNAQES